MSQPTEQPSVRHEPPIAPLSLSAPQGAQWAIEDVLVGIFDLGFRGGSPAARLLVRGSCGDQLVEVLVGDSIQLCDRGILTLVEVREGSPWTAHARYSPRSEAL